MSQKFYISIGRYLKIHLLFFPLAAASIIGGYYISFFTAYISALIHEAGHILTARILGVEISHIEVLPFGICGRLKDDFIKNPDKEIIIALSGPTVSFAIALSVFLWNRYLGMQDIAYNYLLTLNLLLGIVNLVPALPLDGGRVLRAQLTKKLGAVPAIKISLFISFIGTAFILCLSVYGLLTSSFNFSLILISSFLLSSLCVERSSVSKSVLSEMLTYKDKLGNENFTKSTLITANRSLPARKILKMLSYDRYHIVCVTDDELNIERVLTEGKIVSALTEKGINVTLEEI